MTKNTYRLWHGVSLLPENQHWTQKGDYYGRNYVNL